MNFYLRIVAICLPIVLVLSCPRIFRGQDRSRLIFVDSTSRAGISAQHFDGGGATSMPYLPQLMVAGLALLDFDGDGWTDIYLLSGHELRGQAGQAAVPPRASDHGNSLYRNNHDGTFSDVTQAAGVGSGSFALGAVAADLDNDGDQDLLTSNFGKTELFTNNGDGTFSLTSPSSPAWAVAGSQNQFGAGISCLDIENDGLLDVFASNYVQFSYAKHDEAARRASPYPPGPKDFPPATDRLLRNCGDGSFIDVSEASGVLASPGPSMGLVCGDFDGDDDADIFVCCDAAANHLFVNDGTGKFVEMGLAAGVAFDLTGNANGSMGVDAGDYDNDGLIDLLLTNYTGQTPVLYRNLGQGLFEDASRLARVGREVLAHTNWGVGLVDFDNDRDLDAFFANGHFLKNIQSIDDRTAYRVRNTLMMNDGAGRFSDVSSSAGSGMQVVQSSRGAGFDDMDGDGDIDMVILNANALPTYAENQSSGIGDWIRVGLVGTTCNRDAVGASVRVSAAGRDQVAMVHAGRGYQSHYGTVLHFGLGQASTVDKIEVRWPGGRLELFDCESVRQTLLLVEGQGRPLLRRIP